MNCRHTPRIAGPLSLRKLAIVLKSGINRPVNHISSTLRCLTFQAAARLDAVEVAVEIDLQQGRWMIAWPACCLRGHPLKTQLGQIELSNENIDHPNRIIIGYVVFQAAR